MHKACRNQSVPLTIVKKYLRQRHVVLKATNSRYLAPHKQSEIDCDDGIADDKDACPLLKGDAAHAGCPDTDADGVFDNEDKCPQEKGTVELKGCTDKDTDHDFVPDVLDACPFRVGPAENKGCPVE